MDTDSATLFIQEGGASAEEIVNGISKEAVLGAAVGAIGGAVAGGLVTAAVVGKTRRKRKSSRKRNSRNHKRGKRKQRQPYTARKGKDRSHRRIRFTKNNQPYVILASGKARFIKRSSVKRSRKMKGGRY